VAGPRGVRARLAASLVALVVVAAVVLGVGTSLFVDNRLHDQALREAEAQAGFDLAVIVPERQLPEDPTLDDIVDSRLAETFAQRGTQVVVDVGAERPFVSRSDLDGLLEALPASMREIVDDGRLAYAWVDVGDVPSLVVGGRPAGGGPAFYFVHGVGEIEAAVDQLRLGLFLAGIVLVLLALVTARSIARGVLAPVDEARQAADRIAAGDLTARVPVTSHDEFGEWAVRFNHMADALVDTIRRLEDAQDQNRRFVADVSHELRTPVAALVAEASVLDGQLDALPPETRRAGELLIADVRRLRTLVDELMELSRFDAAAEVVSIESVDLVRLIESVARARLPTARFAPPAPSVVVDTDPRRVERILGNFLDNAREHAGGADVEITLETGPEALILAVSDRGPGVPPDRLDLIFERFSKLDPSRSGGSSGLGLAIAAEHAAILGGYLQADLRDGGGLRMELVLPADVPGSLRGGDGFVSRGSDDEGPPSRTREPVR
jgi:signal transduction histidine kinase